LLHHNTYIHPSSKHWVTFVHGAGGSSSIWFKQLRSFSSHFNILVLDLRGHGKSKEIDSLANANKYTFDAITKDIFEVLDFLKIKSSHFVGISLGTILIRNLAEKEPQRVSSMIMGGAIMKMNLRSQVLMKLNYLLLLLCLEKTIKTRVCFLLMKQKNYTKKSLLNGFG